MIQVETDIIVFNSWAVYTDISFLSLLARAQINLLLFLLRSMVTNNQQVPNLHTNWYKIRAHLR